MIMMMDVQYFNLWLHCMSSLTLSCLTAVNALWHHCTTFITSKWEAH